MSPSIVSGRVVATIIFSSFKDENRVTICEKKAHWPEFSMGYAKDVITPNSNFSFGSYPGTLSNVRPVSCFWSTCQRCMDSQYETPFSRKKLPLNLTTLCSVEHTSSQVDWHGRWYLPREGDRNFQWQLSTIPDYRYISVAFDLLQNVRNSRGSLWKLPVTSHNFPLAGITGLLSGIGSWST